MSSSKGIGASSVEVSQILPAEILRFLMVRPRPMQHIDFDPGTEHTIPKLFDDYDSARNSKEPDLQRIGQLSIVEGSGEKYFVPRFSDLLNLVQMPNIDVKKEAEAKKGAKLTKEDLQALERRVGYAKIYLDRFAPEKLKFDVKDSLPKEAKDLSANQKKLLMKITQMLEDSTEPEKFQDDIYKVGKDLGLSSAETFQAIYRSLIGKDSGPKAAWLILSLDKDFIRRRFSEAAK